MAAEKAKLARRAAARLSLDRYGSIEYTLLPEIGHGDPTVAKSSLTASAKANDLSQPTPKRSRFPPLLINRSVTPLTPRRSGIPTPASLKTSPRAFRSSESSDLKVKNEVRSSFKSEYPRLKSTEYSTQSPFTSSSSFPHWPSLFNP